jgi:hypothetical protein
MGVIGSEIKRFDHPDGSIQNVQVVSLSLLTIFISFVLHLLLMLFMRCAISIRTFLFPATAGIMTNSSCSVFRRI